IHFSLLPSATHTLRRDGVVMRAHRRLEFDPFLEVRSQSSTPRGQSVVVVRPIGDLPVLGPNNGRPVQRGFDLSFESAVERLCQGCIKSPFGDHALTDHENRISLEPSVWKGLSRLLEEFSQSLLICKLQSKSVIFEPEFFGKPASASSTLPFFNCDKTVNTTP